MYLKASQSLLEKETAEACAAPLPSVAFLDAALIIGIKNSCK